MSNRIQLASDLSTLLHLFSDCGYVDFKEGHEPLEDYEGVLKLGWVARTSIGGSWRRINLTPKGVTLAEKVFNLVEKSTGFSGETLLERSRVKIPSEEDLDEHQDRILCRHMV